ncbi:unnamed protein product [Nezara viridula]|uniref:Cadherin domain-containing protein n=1 Tax=Nezara viridula TaxID=85310 RepID=A0A9P0H7B4_NEZVI|nr:unnamed protein product [Nezara viridula]
MGFTSYPTIQKLAVLLTELPRQNLRVVSASDPDCGVNSIVNYTIGGRPSQFTVRSDSGEVCISSPLDYETRQSYEFPIIATDRDRGPEDIYAGAPALVDINSDIELFLPGALLPRCAALFH